MLLETLIGKQIETKELSRIILSKYDENYRFVTICADEVHSVSDGVVMFIGNSPDGTHNIVEYISKDEILVYGNLIDVQVVTGKNIHTGNLIARGNEGLMTFMYCNQYSSGKISPLELFRIEGKEYYKKDPTSILCGYRPLKSTSVQYIVDQSSTVYAPDDGSEQFTEEQLKDYTTGR